MFNSAGGEDGGMSRSHFRDAYLKNDWLLYWLKLKIHFFSKYSNVISAQWLSLTTLWNGPQFKMERSGRTHF